MTFSQVLALGGLVAAVLGWFIAWQLRLDEAQRQSRHATYAKVIGPAAEMVAVLSQARFEDRQTWVACHAESFNRCFVKLVAAVGEVQLVRKRRRAWRADVRPGRAVQRRHRSRAAIALFEAHLGELPRLLPSPSRFQAVDGPHVQAEPVDPERGRDVGDLLRQLRGTLPLARRLACARTRVAYDPAASPGGG